MKTELHNLTGVNWTYTWWNSIGATVSWEWTFTTLEKADKLAVEFYIPSNYKFLKTIWKQNNTRWNKPFEVFGDGRCRWNITHYEVRFDRLFIYYNQLPSNTTCGFRIKTIKAFEWKTKIMPVHIFEMYKTNVWGRKIVNGE